MKKKITLKVILMDDNTEGYFEEGGLRAVRRADKKCEHYLEQFKD